MHARKTAETGAGLHLSLIQVVTILQCLEYSSRPARNSVTRRGWIDNRNALLLGADINRAQARLGRCLELGFHLPDQRLLRGPSGGSASSKSALTATKMESGAVWNGADMIDRSDFGQLFEQAPDRDDEARARRFRRSAGLSPRAPAAPRPPPARAADRDRCHAVDPRVAGPMACPDPEGRNREPEQRRTILEEHK